MAQQWVVTWECSEAEMRSLARELEWTVVSVGRLKEKLYGVEGEVATRGIEEYEALQRDIARICERADKLLAALGNEEAGWRLVDEDDAEGASWWQRQS